MFNTRNNNKLNKGFTIIELLVVIAIIALISSVVLVSMRGSTGKAKIAKSLEFSQTILNVIGVDAVGIWTFDEGTGDYAYDKSGYGNHGTLIGKPEWVEGEENTPHWYVNEGEGRWALDFNGTSDYVSISTSGIYTNTVTIEFWTKTSSTKSYQAVLGSNVLEKYEILLKTGSYPSHVEVSLDSGNYAQWNSIFPKNKWTHIVIVAKNGVQWYLYKNGVDQGAPDNIAGAYQVDGTGINNIDIGRLRNNSGFLHAGIIDEVRIYASALSSAEIQQHYADGAKKHEIALK